VALVPAVALPALHALGSLGGDGWRGVVQEMISF
jgi:hypothetical protein